MYALPEAKPEWDENGNLAANDQEKVLSVYWFAALSVPESMSKKIVVCDRKIRKGRWYTCDDIC